MEYIITEEQDERINLRRYRLISSYLDDLYYMEVKKKYKHSNDKVFIFRDKSTNKTNMANETGYKTLGLNITPIFNSIRTLFPDFSIYEIKESLKYYIKLKTEQEITDFHYTTWD